MNKSSYKMYTELTTEGQEVRYFRSGKASLSLIDTGNPRSPIDGHTVSIKDNICTEDYPTSCASKILDGYHSPYPATVVTKLRDAGAVVVGKTTLDEFGMGFVFCLY